MSTSPPDTQLKKKAIKAAFVGEVLTIELEDGQTLMVPTSLFPRLRFATQAERKNFQWLGKGTGMHWPDLDEDISIDALLQGQGSMESAESVLAWVMSRKTKPSEATTIKILPRKSQPSVTGKSLRARKQKVAQK